MASAAIGIASPTSARRRPTPRLWPIDSSIRSADTSRDAVEPQQVVAAERVEVGRALEQPGLAEALDPDRADGLDVGRRARGPVDQPAHGLGRAGDVRAVELAAGALLGQRLRARRARRPAATISRSAPVRLAASSTPATNGITSPARRTSTVSPMRTSRARITSWLTQRRPRHAVVPPTNTVSSAATDEALPILATTGGRRRRACGVRSSAAYLKASAPRGELRRVPTAAAHCSRPAEAKRSRGRSRSRVASFLDREDDGLRLVRRVDPCPARRPARIRVLV